MWWFVAAAGIALLTPLAIWWDHRHPVNRQNWGCPQCWHQFGLDNTRTTCGDVDHNNGWSSDFCNCQDDYHWRYEAVVEHPPPARIHT